MGLKVVLIFKAYLDVCMYNTVDMEYYYLHRQLFTECFGSNDPNREVRNIIIKPRLLRTSHQYKEENREKKITRKIGGFTAIINAILFAKGGPLAT